jgi:OmpA-OmpF porin, OOP family
MKNPILFLKTNKLVFVSLSLLLLISSCVSRREYLDLKRELAEIKARPQFDPTDTDGDGVIDMFDQEKVSPAGAPVDSKGVILDSDRDGVADYKDKEPYSLIGYKVDKNGVAQVAKPNYMTESDINRLIEARLANFPKSSGSGSMGLSFFKTITFATTKTEFNDSDDALSILAEVSHIMRETPSLRLLVSGFASDHVKEFEDNVLSFKRADAIIKVLENTFGLERQRMTLNYHGHNRTINSKNIKAKINSRVELSTATVETEMAEPKKN